MAKKIIPSSGSDKAQEIKDAYQQVRDRIKEIRGEMILLNLAFIALGIVMIIIPKQFTEFIGQILGGALCIWGVIRCIAFLRLKEDEMFGSYALVQGAAMLGFGIFFLTQPYRFTNLLNSALVLVILIAAVFKLQNAINYMKLKVRYWWVHLLIAAVMIVFGIIAIVRPGWVDDEAGLAVLITVITGVAFIISGVWDLFSVMYMSKLVRKKTEELEAAGVIPKSPKSRKDKNVVRVKAKDVQEKLSKEEEKETFSDPELDEIDNLDYDDGYDEKKK